MTCVFTMSSTTRGESNDLSKTRPDLVKDFTERILAWRQEKGMSGYLTIYE